MVEVVRACRACSSPFLEACTARRVLRCRSCNRIIVLGVREAAPDVFPVDVVTTISGLDDKRVPAGWAVATHMTPRRICEQVVQREVLAS